jgi:hypothetical protein
VGAASHVSLMGHHLARIALLSATSTSSPFGMFSERRLYTYGRTYICVYVYHNPFIIALGSYGDSPPSIRYPSSSALHNRYSTLALHSP